MVKKIVTLFVFTLLLSGSVLAQKAITGTVTDTNGEMIIGANVVVKGSNPVVGAATDQDGKFSLKVPSGFNRLIVSYLGYKSKEIEVTDQKSYEIELEEGMESANESLINNFFYSF